MLTAEVLGRIVTGADLFAETPHGGLVLRHSGYLFIAINASSFVTADHYEASVAGLFQRVRTVPPAAGFDRVMIPGDPEAEARDAARQGGIELPEELVDAVRTLGRHPEHDRR
jgi:LDH2 family malate/lactate/ureidoglycolate dehydrogenase